MVSNQLKEAADLVNPLRAVSQRASGGLCRDRWPGGGGNPA